MGVYMSSAGNAQQNGCTSDLVFKGTQAASHSLSHWLPKNTFSPAEQDMVIDKDAWKDQAHRRCNPPVTYTFPELSYHATRKQPEWVSCRFTRLDHQQPLSYY
jgi:hypothetical protein